MVTCAVQYNEHAMNHEAVGALPTTTIFIGLSMEQTRDVVIIHFTRRRLRKIDPYISLKSISREVESYRVVRLL